ncbi:MAG: hypothetical protein QMC80_02385 [Thermoplasmatales archaeon]|nr:hypothetical protein [Thermoplasmatales archaeon]
MSNETDTLRKFLDNLPSKPCKTRPEPKLCRICMRLNKKVALRCPFSGIKLERAMFEEPRIEVIRAKEKIPVLEPLPPPPPELRPAPAVKPIPAPPPEAQPVPTLEPIPAVPKMKTRLTELKNIRRKKISILIGVIPILFGIILAGLGAYLYNTIKDYPPSPAPYNISILAGGFWIIAGLILMIVSGTSKKEFLHALCIILGTLGMIAGIIFIGFGYRLYLITETLSGVEPYYTTYNVSAFIGICSIIIFLIILLYGLLSKK